MKKKILFLLLMLMPMSLMAQTLVTDPESGLEYLDDGDGRLYIDVAGGTSSFLINGIPSNQYFVTDGGVRSNWRQNIPDARLKNQPKWYKEYMDEIKVFAQGNNEPESFKGIEYFRNLEELTVKQDGGGKNRKGKKLDLDLSKNTKLKVLNFATPTTARISKLNISNTQLTSLTLPAGSKNYLTELRIVLSLG